MADPGKHRVEDFHLGADVISSDGKHVGTLDRVIVDDKLQELHEFVVKESKLFSGHLLSPGSALMTDDLIVPVAAVASSSHDRIVLNLAASEVRRLHPYLSYSRAPLTGSDVVGEAVSMLGAQPHVPRLEEHADKTADELEIDEGESVMVGLTGEKAWPCQRRPHRRRRNCWGRAASRRPFQARDDPAAAFPGPERRPRSVRRTNRGRPREPDSHRAGTVTLVAIPSN